ncbi:cytosolic phospholipase A2 gamma-like isoform X2 [Labeo rohita]|uniref:cytosolic phospholipase A2 gamma-like isoform X2 n=1 Tax=Labeo rohita TaxID=84645 RepID=UPI0021E23170|nr:cytosolic phospholipase A2 gamma-like isoform X2 [Labeo rohita]
MGTCPSHESSGKVRISPSLHKKEKEFVAKRRKFVLKSLQKLNINCSKDKVPNIALLGSGGGQRAMVGLLGSLVELDKAGLLDCILYLSGVSGSTWCMASLYHEPDWSTNLDTVKDKIIKRLNGPGVNAGDAFAQLCKYHRKDFFSLTDVWAVMAVTEFVKKIDNCTLTDQWNKHKKVPFPIYTVIDKRFKQQGEEDLSEKETFDSWFEISPYEAGYSLIGAFVDTPSFGSQFDNGCKIKSQPEMDMLYLQALCGSAMADGYNNMNYIWEQIKVYLSDLISKIKNWLPKEIDEEIAEKGQQMFQVKILNFADKEATKWHIKNYTLDLIDYFNGWLNFWPFDVFLSTCRCVSLFTWGRKYDFLHNMKHKAVPAALLESETRDYEDAGLLLNSPYFSVLREERNIDLIISLDFSEGDPFETVRKAATMCENQNIPFPDVQIPSEDLEKPKDFYVFKGKNAPTVIHIPLFNKHNCGEPWFEISPHEAGYSLTGAFVETSSFGSQFDKGHKIKEQPEMDMLYLQDNKICHNSWFEINPYEAGYSLTGAFVETSSFGSQFDKGRKIKEQPEMDMLYLQALCGSALADGEENAKFIWEKIEDLMPTIKSEMIEELRKDPNSPSVYQVLMDLVEMNLAFLNGKDPSAFDQKIRETLTELAGDKHHMIFPGEKLNVADKEAAKLYMKRFTEDVCTDLNQLPSETADIILRIFVCICQWIWGRKYNFLYQMADKAVPSALQKSETRDYEDAGLLLSSSYFSVLREERYIDLIISLDFCNKEAFKTVTDAADMCKKQNIPFPEVNIPDEDVDNPKDFYVFKGQNAPTVIHIPLFNVVNCGEALKEMKHKYETFQAPYNTEKITELMKLAGKNISNNKEKLLEQIGAVIEQKRQQLASENQWCTAF